MKHPDNFLQRQLTFPRVQEAVEKYNTSLQTSFFKSGLNYPGKSIYIRTFKLEQIVEVWVRDHDTFVLLKTYPFTAASGFPGPKKIEADGQIPEGFYHITNFNPESKFHLSLKINYPNLADNNRTKTEISPGSDIYFHGGHKTLGCIPIGDDNIAELYCLCIHAYNQYPHIPVHIFPCRMEEKKLNEIFRNYPVNIDFWNSIIPMYQYFQLNKMLLAVTGFDDFGNYTTAI